MLLTGALMNTKLCSDMFCGVSYTSQYRPCFVSGCKSHACLCITMETATRPTYDLYICTYSALCRVT